jgi:aminoglycoside phosphotransferase (APT) family kinase protein
VALGVVGVEMLARDRFVTCDWDGYNVADPARDAACFVVDLKRLAWKNPTASAAFHQAADVFLKTYLARCRRSAGSNLQFYAAARCLRLARRDIGDDEPERAAVMLEEGLRFLEQWQSAPGEDG